jgi:hypothetical protein
MARKRFWDALSWSSRFSVLFHECFFQRSTLKRELQRASFPLSLLVGATVGCSTAIPVASDQNAVVDVATREAHVRTFDDPPSDPVTTVPFPNRSNPFTIETASSSFGTVDADDSDSIVESTNPQLRGYVDVDGIAALFLHKGELHLLSPGSELDGMTVVSITPPEVNVTIRGESKTITLYNE